MRLEKVFKLSLYCLIAFGGFVLGVAEGEGMTTGLLPNRLLLPFLSIPIAFVGYLFTERRLAVPSGKNRGLSSLWANFLGLIALGATFYEFSSDNHEAKLLAGSHLLLYATWIVLIQTKTIRLYWFLLALGILQLAVASVLTKQGWFGFGAMAYMFSAVWTLSVFSLWRAERQFEEFDRQPSFDGNTAPHMTLNSTRRRPTGSRVRSSVRHESGTQWLSYRFVTGVLLSGCAALFVGIAFFAFVPRVWLLPEFSLREDAKSSSLTNLRQGVATTVKLGDVANALESKERVFEIRLSDVHTDELISAQAYAERLGMAEPLFRGAVLTNYENGRWKMDGGRSIPSEIPQGRGGGGPRLDDNRYKTITVRQEIRLEPNASHTLYSLGRPIFMSRMRGSGRNRHSARNSTQPRFGSYDDYTGIITRTESNDWEYVVWTAMPEVQQSNFKLKISDTTRSEVMKTKYLKNATQVPDSLERLKKLSRELIEKEKDRRKKLEQLATPRELTPIETVTLFENYLRDSGIYKYARESLLNDPQSDPVEEFLFNRKEGHCEYFATALALMARSAGVPARVVSGYKGGIPHPEKNGVYEIQQRFSHLWVEAWVDKDGWTTFDATPMESRTQSIAELDLIKPSVWSEVQNTLSSLWSENVLKMSLDHQEESIYRPMRELAYSLWSIASGFFVSPNTAYLEFLNLITNQELWLSVGGAIFGSVLLVIFLAPLWFIRKWLYSVTMSCWRYIHWQSRKRQRVVAFYQRFAKIAGSRGLSRTHDQTQREFAEQVANAYLPELKAARISDTPRQISQLFYRVRFGNDDLSTEDLDRLEIMLDNFESVVSAEPYRASSHNPSFPDRQKLSS